MQPCGSGLDTELLQVCGGSWGEGEPVGEAAGVVPAEGAVLEEPPALGAVTHRAAPHGQLAAADVSARNAGLWRPLYVSALSLSAFVRNLLKILRFALRGGLHLMQVNDSKSLLSYSHPPGMAVSYRRFK